MTLINAEQKGLAQLLDKHGQLELQKTVRALDKDDLYFTFIRERVNPTHQKELGNYFNDDPCNATFLASAIRHIFVHGDLTPSAGKTEAGTAEAICDVLSDAHLHVMSEEFGDRVEEMLDEIYGSG